LYILDSKTVLIYITNIFLKMNRPEVRIVQDQQEEIKPADISQNEAEMLLAKYGYKSNNNQNYQNTQSDELSFEEMIRQEEEKNRQRMHEQMLKANGPKPYTFGGSYDANTSYGTDGDSGYTFKVSVVSDMPLPKSGH
jgi:hypothetical protein